MLSGSNRYRQGRIGQTGTIPTNKYMQKQEITCIIEDPNLLRNHQLQSLRDRRPEKPLYNSDQIRGGLNEDGSRRRTAGETMGILNLRYGGRRCNTEPYLPDGTFLDHQFVGGAEIEPRSISYQPNFRKVAEQWRARGRQHKFYSDKSTTIHEKGWNPTQLSKDLAHFRNLLKGRLKVFETARVGRHNGSGVMRDLTRNNQLDLSVMDSELPQLEGATLRTRKDFLHTAAMSLPIGWNTTVDHRFRIAHYGPQSNKSAIQDKDWYQNTRAAKNDHEVYVSYEDRVIPLNTAIMLINMTQQRRNELAKEKDSIAFSNSMELYNIQHKLVTMDLLGREQKHTGSHTDVYQENMNASKKFDKKVRKVQNASKLNHKIFDLMTNKNRKLSPQQTDDLRKMIKQSASKMELFAVNNTKTAAKRGNIRMAKNGSQGTHRKGKELKTANYRNVAYENKHNISKLAKEGYGSQSIKMNNKAIRDINVENMDSRNTIIDNDFGSDATFNKHHGGVSEDLTSIRRHMVQNRGDDELMSMREISRRG
jgi:hypothetical protein